MRIATIIVKWSPPHPNPLPTDIRVDHGGWIYQIFEGTRKLVGGTSHGAEEKAHVRGIEEARRKGFTHASINGAEIQQIR